jgi:hypothetical protein
VENVFKELFPPNQHLFHSFVVMKHKFTSFEMGENEFRWMPKFMKQMFTTTTNDHGFNILLISKAEAKSQS